MTGEVEAFEHADGVRGHALELAQKRDFAGLRKLEGRVVRFAELLARENDAEHDAAEYLRLRLDICRGAGELLAAMEKKRNRFSSAETLSALLEMDTANAQFVASRWQRIAGIPEDLYVEYRDAADEPSVAGALRLAATGRLEPLMSSRVTEWETPPDLFADLDAEFAFDIDVCATALNAKCPTFFTPDQNGLAQDWVGVCFMNPPYGKGIGEWMAKAHLAADAGATVVCLVPARPDTAWFWDHARHGELRFLRGRLRFSGGDPAPFPSSVVVFGRPPSVIWWDR